MRKAKEDMTIVTNRGTSQKQTTNKLQQNKDSNYMHVNNINMTNVKIFFVRLSDNKHRLLRLYIK